jgi:ABC-type antimicrobial peptide transport system permease subunit
VNSLQVRADSADSVTGLSDRIETALPGADVVTASDLADRVGGSLDDANSLSSRLGTALAIVALLAAFLIASLLTLSSVQKRIRELGTLKALGWRQRLVVRQVTGEAVVLGAFGGILGAAVGLAAAGVIDAVGPTLEASVQGRSGAAFGQGDIAGGTTSVVLGAPVDVKLLLLAIGFAIVGGLVAGAAGGFRAARLRPAAALRSAE